MDEVYQIIKCEKCGRKMLVIRTLIGIDHDANIHILCPDCSASIDWENDQWARENPEIAKELRKHLGGD